MHRRITLLVVFVTAAQPNSCTGRLASSRHIDGLSLIGDKVDIVDNRFAHVVAYIQLASLQPGADGAACGHAHACRYLDTDEPGRVRRRLTSIRSASLIRCAYTCRPYACGWRGMAFHVCAHIRRYVLSNSTRHAHECTAVVTCVHICWDYSQVESEMSTCRNIKPARQCEPLSRVLQRDAACACRRSIVG